MRFLFIFFKALALILINSCSSFNTLPSSQGFAQLNSLSIHYENKYYKDPPQDINNICHIFHERIDWYIATSAASQKWKTPVPIIMSMLYQESSFKAEARPLHKITRHRLSSAYGYAQVLDATWDMYLKNDGNKKDRKRNRFSDAVDFVGWYNQKSHERNQISPQRADLLYLNYHEGWGGYSEKTYRKKRWLQQAAKKVQTRSRTYAKQLAGCQSSLDRSVAKKAQSNAPRSSFAPKAPKASELKTKQPKGGWF